MEIIFKENELNYCVKNNTSASFVTRSLSPRVKKVFFAQKKLGPIKEVYSYSFSNNIPAFSRRQMSLRVIRQKPSLPRDMLFGHKLKGFPPRLRYNIELFVSRIYEDLTENPGNIKKWERKTRNVSRRLNLPIIYYEGFSNLIDQDEFFGLLALFCSYPGILNLRFIFSLICQNANRLLELP